MLTPPPSPPLAPQIHGWLMAVGWGVLIPCGIATARSFKDVKGRWFLVHRRAAWSRLCVGG